MLSFATLIMKIGEGHQLVDFQKCAADSQWAQKPSLCKMAVTKMGLESLFLKLETCPGCLCGAEIKTLQMRPSQPKSEVVTNRQIFQKPPRNQKIFQLSGTKTALAAKPWVLMTRETTQINRLVSGFEMRPWRWKSEMVANWQIFQKPTLVPKIGHFSQKIKFFPKTPALRFWFCIFWDPHIL